MSHNCFLRHFFAPFIPEVKGISLFPGLVSHSHWYREPEPFTGQAVLVVGTGPSGEDLIVYLSSHARVIYLSSRKGPINSIVPENVEQLPGIAELREDGRVCFDNGEERSVDCVILATGYLYSYPFLNEESGIKVVEGKRVTYLYKHTFNVAHPSMAMIGIYFATIPLPAYDIQIQWVLSVWRGEKSLPPKQEMLEVVEKAYQQRLDEGIPPQLAGHYIEEIQWDLFREFAEFGGVKPLDDVVKEMYDVATYNRMYKLLEYRNNEYEVVNESTYRLVERK